MAFVCNVCKEQYHNRTLFINHFLAQHTSHESGDSPLYPESALCPQSLPPTDLRTTRSICVCEICFKCTSDMSSLSEHILSHVGAMPYFCEPCAFATLSIQIFAQHSKHSPILENISHPLECDLCDGAFHSLNELVCHYAHHLRAMPFICKKCLVMFSEKKDFIIHNHIHKLTLVCDICQLSNTSHRNLLQHVLTHNPTKYFKDVHSFISSTNSYATLVEKNSNESQTTNQQHAVKFLRQELQSATKSGRSDCISRSTDKIASSLSNITQCDDSSSGTIIPKPSLIPGGNISNQELLKKISREESKMAIVKPIQTSTKRKTNNGESTGSIVSDASTSSRSLLKYRISLRELSNLYVQPESNTTAQSHGGNPMIISDRLPIDGNPLTETQDPNSTNESPRIRNLRPRTSSAKAQNDHLSKNVVKKQQKITKYVKTTSLEKPILHQNQLDEKPFENPESSTIDTGDLKSNEISIVKSLKQCTVVLEKLPDFVTKMHLLARSLRDASRISSKPKSLKSASFKPKSLKSASFKPNSLKSTISKPKYLKSTISKPKYLKSAISKSKVALLNSSLAMSVNIKKEKLSDDETDSHYILNKQQEVIYNTNHFPSSKNTFETNHTSRLLNHKNSSSPNSKNCAEKSSSIPFSVNNSSDHLKNHSGRDLNSVENTSETNLVRQKKCIITNLTSQAKFMQKKSPSKNFASLNQKSLGSCKLNSRQKKHLPLSKILPRPVKRMKQTPKTLKNTKDKSECSDSIKLHPALEDHNYFSFKQCKYHLQQ